MTEHFIQLVKAKIQEMWQEPYERRFLNDAFIKQQGKSYCQLEDIWAWLEKAEDEEINKMMWVIGFYASMVCDIELVPNEIRTFFPQLIASYPISSTKEFQTFNGCKKYFTDLFGEELDAPLKGCFFKLSSRSAKDCKKIQANSIDDLAVAFFNSLRIPEDLISYVGIYGKANLNFYEWLEDCNPAKEVRCFVRERKLQGITKYQISGVAEYSPDFPQKVKTFVEEKVIPASKDWLANFVVDVYESADGSVKVLEFNPYNLSDPCLYGSHANIGNPLIIEEDIYDIASKRKYFI